MSAHFYSVAALIVIIIWTALYILLPQSRAAIFWTSLIFAPAGPVSEYWHNLDYWHPPYLIDIAIGSWRFGLEDYLVAFAAAGISAATFEHLASRRGWPKLPRISLRTLLWMELWGVLGLALTALLASGVGMNSIYATILTAATVSLLMLFRKWEILLLAVPTGVIFALLLWLLYTVLLMPISPGLIETFWHLDATWGIRLAGVPIEELLWAFTAGLFAGPVFRVCSASRS